jgi:hypothetical protein
MSIAADHSSDRRLLGFLAVSVALHVLWLAVPLPTRTLPPPLPALIAHLTQPAAPQKSAVVVWNAPHGVRQLERGSPTASAPAAPIVPTDTAPEPATPAINLDAAFATARSQAHEAQPRTALDAPKPELTVETAVARATRRDVLVETRGAAGEYVTMNGNSRCVTPLVVPHFLEGKTMLTQCEARKG